MTAIDYKTFLDSKVDKVANYGHSIPKGDIHPKLFEWQKDIVVWAVQKGRCAVFLDTGLGKTFIQLEWSRLTGVKTLIIAPLSVARQTVREAKKIDLDIQYVRAQSEITGNQIYITNYEMADQFDYSKFGAVVLDECFPPDTPIDVFSIDNHPTKMYIKDIREGDLIYNANGKDIVKETHKRRINRAVQIGLNGNRITSSENHPYFTLHGWRCAQDLRAGDYIMETDAAMRLVRGNICPQSEQPENAEVLREILFSELADAPAGDYCESSYKRGTREDRQEAKCLSPNAGWDKKDKSLCGNQTDASSGDARTSVVEIADDEARTFRAWGQWTPHDITSAIAEGCSIRRLDCGISYITGETSTRFSHLLQGGLRKSRIENCNRDRRVQPPITETARPEERRKTGFVRVDSVEILEQGNPELEKYRDADGNIYFYDVKAERHPSFSINGVLVHNSSILKSIGGATRKTLTELCANIPYRLCCTATPAPNDYIELGNHTEFLGICKMSEMLSMFFVNANKEHTLEYEGIIYRKKGTNKAGTEWRLKHHAEQPFFRWLASWAITMVKPSDLGYDDDGFILPPLNITPMYIHTDYKPKDQLFFTELHGIGDRAQVRQDTVQDKLAKLKETVNSDSGQWIIWCGLDNESKEATKILEAVEVKGTDSIEHKVTSIEQFQDGQIRILVTKPKIAGFGMNFQNANNMVFFGINDSWETYYQAIRREWRYGQIKPVNVYIIMHEAESEIYQNILRKDAMAKRLRELLIEHIRDYEKGELGVTEKLDFDYQEKMVKSDGWIAMLGDSCQRLGEMAGNSIDLSVYSPPFADLFTYTASDRDLGNSKDWDEFFNHYGFIISELLRVTKPGRLTCVHSSDIPAMAQKDGYIGVKDFPGEVIRAYEKCGWIFTGRAFVDKNPQAQAIRIKSKALLFVQLRKDSSDSRPALIDQILLFKKPGDNEVPIMPVKNGELDNETWIEWAHGIWLGIRETDTLQFHTARSQDDEKHICPLQLGTIERCIKLYSNPGEMVLTPFGGIGSEAYMALKLGRRATLIELKPEYFEVAVKNLKSVGNGKLGMMVLDIPQVETKQVSAFGPEIDGTSSWINPDGTPYHVGE